jgi:hypothetical protein
VTSWVYVDESKRAGYVMAAVSVADPVAARKVIRELILPGQRRLHMKREQPRRRGIIVSALVTTEVTTTIYDAGRLYRSERVARAACLTALVDDLANSSGDTHLVIEQDDSLVSTDQTTLYHGARRAHRDGLPGIVHYDHQRAYEELLLALPDVVAWCWVRSGEWRRRIDPILANVRQVGP